jgi:phosphonatase-like hydrolase
MNLELVIFDMAGTTVKDDDAVNACLREAMAPVAIVGREQVNEVMGLPKPEAIRLLLKKKHPDAIPVSNELVDRLHRDFLERMLKHYRTAPGIEPMPYAVELFQQLRKAGVKVALDTGFSRPIVDAILARLGWDGRLLDATVASDEVTRGRPHADLTLRAMKLTGVQDAQRVAKVGDTPSDLLEGTSAGCRWVIGVTNGTHTRDQLASFPHTNLVNGLREVTALLLG